GQATEYAVREFAKVGIQLASAVTGGAARGLEKTVGDTLAAYGLNYSALRYLGMGLAGLVGGLSVLIVLGLPVRWMFRPNLWPSPSGVPTASLESLVSSRRFYRTLLHRLTILHYIWE